MRGRAKGTNRPAAADDHANPETDQVRKPVPKTAVTPDEWLKDLNQAAKRQIGGYSQHQPTRPKIGHRKGKHPERDDVVDLVGFCD